MGPITRLPSETRYQYRNVQQQKQKKNQNDFGKCDGCGDDEDGVGDQRHLISNSKRPTRLPSRLVRIWGRLVQLITVAVIALGAVVTAVTIHNYYHIDDPITPVSFLDKISLLLGVHEEISVTVLDIAFTSSTVYVYVFHRRVADGSFQISSESKKLLLPGLFDHTTDKSDLGDDPAHSELQARIDDLLRTAHELESEKRKTNTYPSLTARTPSPPPPAVLVRVSPRALEQAEAIQLDAVLIALSKAVLAYSPQSSIGTLDQAEETVLQWLSINLLRHKITNYRPELSSVILDVGESNVLITFAVDSSFKAPSSQSIQVRKFSAFGHMIKLVTLTLPRLGLLEARHNILLTPVKGEGAQENVSMSEDGIDLLRSGCMNPVVEAPWLWKGHEYHVLGKSEPDFEMVKERNGPFAGKKVNRPVASYEECHAASVGYLDRSQLNANTSWVIRAMLKGREVFMSGLLLEKCLERGLTLPYRGGDVRMKSFVDSLVHACKVPNTDQPYACADLMYLATLLDRLLGMKQGSVLRSASDIGGMSGEWTLAAALHVYENGL